MVFRNIQSDSKYKCLFAMSSRDKNVKTEYSSVYSIDSFELASPWVISLR